MIRSLVGLSVLLVTVSAQLSSATAAPFSQSFSFSTLAEQEEWMITINNDANGPGVPEFGVPDAGSVRIAPIDPATKDTGDIRLVRQIFAPAGEAFSSIKFSGIGQGYGSHVTWAEVNLSVDGINWDVVGKASGGYEEVPIVADATGLPEFEGVSSVYLQVRIVDALGVLSPATASPYARALQFTAETVPAVPEPASLALLAMTGSVLPLLRRAKLRQRS